MAPNSLRILAPAKLNLYLHVLNRREDGYHDLDSLVAFADIGDFIEVSQGHDFTFGVDGPFAASLTAEEQSAGPGSRNLAVIAARRLSELLNIPLKAHLRLTKNLPLASGLGGGSSDAAATVWALLQFWQRPMERERLVAFLKGIGSDVPVCYDCAPQHMEGTGEVLSRIPDLPEMPVVLINPGTPCPTARVFKEWSPPGSARAGLPQGFASSDELLGFLDGTQNDLAAPAMGICPEIAPVLDALKGQEGCRFARLSGSGATAFGIFSDMEAAAEATLLLQGAWPKAWIRAGWLNRARRY